jgi:hypothetical protein
MCDVAACKGLVMTNRNTPPWTDMESIVVQDMAKIGIGVVPRELETGAAYQTIQTVKNDIPIALNAGWGKDYADQYTFGCRTSGRPTSPSRRRRSADTSSTSSPATSR